MKIYYVEEIIVNKENNIICKCTALHAVCFKLFSIIILESGFFFVKMLGQILILTLIKKNIFASNEKFKKRNNINIVLDS